MVKTRWKKLIGDFKKYRSRFVTIWIALAVSIFGISAILSAYIILTREITKNYMYTNPASATFELDNTDEELLDKVRSLDYVDFVEARASLLTRIKVRDGDWQPLRLFVVPDFDDMEVALFYPEEGTVSPPDGTVLIERTAMPLFELAIGDALSIKASDGVERSIIISGTVHDPSLAPAWQERTGYGYITQETLIFLGESGILDDLKVIYSGGVLDRNSIVNLSTSLGEFLQSEGRTVLEIQIPPPGKHPHQSQMEAILVLLLIFSILALILGGILTANLISSIMAKELRQIGVMKTIGASSFQISGIYILSIIISSIIAFLTAIIPGAMAGQALSGVIGSLLNFTLYSKTVPWFIYAIICMFSLSIPIVISLFPIIKGSRITIREAIDGPSLKKVKSKASPISKLLNRTFLLALRNTFRKKGKLILTLTLLAAGGAMFMTALNVENAYKKKLTESFTTRDYDFEIRTYGSVDIEEVNSIIGAVPGVLITEAWNLSPVTPDNKDQFRVTTIYPDGGHGSFLLRGISPGTDLLSLPVLLGNWLETENIEAVVLNQRAMKKFQGKQIGDSIELVINNKNYDLELKGVVEEIGPATAYITDTLFQSKISNLNYAETFMVKTSALESVGRLEIINNIQTALTLNNINVKIIIADAEYRNAIIDHIYILIFSLMLMAGIMVVVGSLGLASTISTNVTERKREFGIIKSIGGTKIIILKMIIFEALLIGVLSYIGAIIVSLPLSYVIGYVLGNMAFMITLPIVISNLGLIIWMSLVLIGSVIAGLIPALRASNMTVNETLAYE